MFTVQLKDLKDSVNTEVEWSLEAELGLERVTEITVGISTMFLGETFTVAQAEDLFAAAFKAGARVGATL